MMEDLNLPSAVATGHFQADLYTQIRKHHAGHRLETNFRSSTGLYLDVRQAETFTIPSPDPWQLQKCCDGRISICRSMLDRVDEAHAIGL